MKYKCKKCEKFIDFESWELWRIDEHIKKHEIEQKRKEYFEEIEE